MNSIFTILSLLPFYFLGSFPSGYLVARSKGVDISTAGSGNVGATNLARVLGKRAGLTTLVLDVSKGFVGVLLATILSSHPYPLLAGAAVVLGHCFSIPGKLKGGKGVAPSLGVFLATEPRVAALGLVAFGVVLLAGRIVSLASISAALLIPIFAIFLGADNETFYLFSAICLLVVYRHHSNISRIIEGREPKIGQAEKI